MDRFPAWAFDRALPVWHNVFVVDSVGPVKLSDQIADTLRAEIVAGEHREPGSLRLVPLAERLGVSTTPVREALAILERQGLVTGHVHRGFQVVELSPTDVADVFEMHAFIMRTLTERAVENLSGAELDELEKLDKQMWKAIRARDAVTARSVNHTIHQRINDAGESGLLVRFLRASAPFVNLNSELRSIRKADREVLGHAAIIDAIRAGDAATAGQLMYDHVMHNGAVAVARAEEAAARAAAE